MIVKETGYVLTGYVYRTHISQSVGLLLDALTLIYRFTLLIRPNSSQICVHIIFNDKRPSKFGFPTSPSYWSSFAYIVYIFKITTHFLHSRCVFNIYLFGRILGVKGLVLPLRSVNFPQSALLLIYWFILAFTSIIVVW